MLLPETHNPDEYELVPRNEIDRLQHEVEKIRHNPFGDSSSSKDLLSAMDKLNTNVSKLVRIFETANDEIVRDYKDSANSAKINKVLEQNEKLAQGIVAIAELMKEQHVSAPSMPEIQPEPEQGPVSQAPMQGAPTWEPGMQPPKQSREISLGDVPPPPPR